MDKREVFTTYSLLDKQHDIQWLWFKDKQPKGLRRLAFCLNVKPYPAKQRCNNNSKNKSVSPSVNLPCKGLPTTAWFPRVIGD